MKTVEDLMTRDPGWLGPEDTIETAWRKMREHSVRHIPVCKDGRLVGLLTQKDLLANAQKQSILTFPVAEIMVMDVESIEADMSLRDAAIVMKDKKLSCLPVIKDGQLAGIVTDSDYLALVIDLLE